MTRNLFLLVGIIGLMLSYCTMSQKTSEKSILIGPNTQPCTAGTVQTECFQVKWTKDQTEWENFYEQIEGFNFEKGYEYELIVIEEKSENQPADASSLKYKLVKEVSKTKAEIPDNASSDNSQNALDWAGTYEGILPCADCEGIKTTITLNADGTFNRTEEYLGKNGKPFEHQGKFEWDKKGSKISLIVNSNNNQKYQVGENQLFHLDNAGNRITGNLANNYILKKRDMKL